MESQQKADRQCMTASRATCVWHCLARVCLTSDLKVVSRVHTADAALVVRLLCNEPESLCLLLSHSTHQMRSAEGANMWRRTLEVLCAHACVE